jgi:hypothetical protein
MARVTSGNSLNARRVAAVLSERKSVSGDTSNWSYLVQIFFLAIF